MRKFFSIATMGLLALALAACGGGESKFSDPGTGPGTGTGGTASTITITSSAAAIPSDGSATADMTALARDANNNAVAGIVITFSATAGNLVVTQGTTDATGVAKATLAATGAAAGTSITVTAAGGGATASMSISVANTQQTVSVTTSLPQIPSDSSKGATITALVRGANNQLLPGVAVDFTATSGGLAVTQATTDQNGAAVATLTAAGDPTNRRITVTATAGSSSATVPVDVAGTKLTVTGAANLVQNSQGTYNISLTDSASNGIAGKTVTLTSSNSNTLNPAGSVTTDATGHATFTLTAVNAGTDTVTADALGMTAQQSVVVSNENFSITAPAANSKIAIGTTQSVTLTWLTGGVPQQGKTISFSTTRGVFTGSVVTTTATTDAAGQASVTISSATSGPAIVTASATGVSTELAMDFIATQANSIAVQASPSTIPISGQSTISAIVRDPQNNLVEGKTVNFQLTDITGGSLSLASAVTDSQGRAQTVYTASTTPSASNGVTITAGVQGTAVSASTTFTVGGQSVFLSLGTGNTISENASKTQFIVPYAVQAVDSAGNAVDGVTITMTIHSVEYGKGGWIVPVNSNKWVQTGTPGAGTVTSITVCPNEDANLNGVLDAGEDTSGNGNNNGVLDPGDIASVSPGTVVTANGGSAAVSVVYPEDHALWVRSVLTATATVQGTETSASATFWLPQLASYVSNTQVNPPGVLSPYGVATVCTNKN